MAGCVGAKVCWPHYDHTRCFNYCIESNNLYQLMINQMGLGTISRSGLINESHLISSGIILNCLSSIPSWSARAWKPDSDQNLQNMRVIKSGIMGHDSFVKGSRTWYGHCDWSWGAPALVGLWLQGCWNGAQQIQQKGKLTFFLHLILTCYESGMKWRNCPYSRRLDRRLAL